MALAILIILIVIIWILIDRYYLSYWKRNGFSQIKPKFVIGNGGNILTASKSILEIFDEFYYNSKGLKFIGFYIFYKPTLLVTDPQLINNIIIRDFNYFHDHSMVADPDNDPLSAHLFSLTGQKWRDLRVKLSPALTSGKLRWMFPVINQCSEVLVKFVEKNIQNDESIFMPDEIFKRYNSNVISSVAYGIDNDCINEPNNDFFIKGLKFFEPNLRNNLRTFLFQFAPELSKVLKVKFAPPDVDKFFMNLIKEIVEYRETNNFNRNDFMDLLIQLKTQGYMPVDKDVLDEDEKSNFETEIEHNSLQKLTFEELAAQAFVFFLGSFETNSAAMTFCLIELARNLKIQQKVQEEIDQVFTAQGVSYESIKNLKYLDCCLLETLRMYPPVPILQRDCTKDYTLPNSDLVIKKGISIIVPIMSIHRDPEIYDNPLEFRPERFLNSPNGSSKLDIEKGVIFYSPFGDGPRHCLGMRMAKLNTKLALASLLSKYNFSLADKTFYDQEIKFDKKSFPLRPENVFKMKVTRR